MSSDHVVIAAAENVLNLAGPEELRDAAIAALEDGLDAPALRVLAGVANPDVDEARRFFARALVELGVQAPSPRDAVMCLARKASADVVRGDVAPYDGAKRIWALTLRVPDEKIAELDPFVYAASEWEDRPADRAFFDDGIVREARALLGS